MMYQYHCITNVFVSHVSHIMCFQIVKRRTLARTSASHT